MKFLPLIGLILALYVLPTVIAGGSQWLPACALLIGFGSMFLSLRNSPAGQGKDDRKIALLVGLGFAVLAGGLWWFALGHSQDLPTRQMQASFKTFPWVIWGIAAAFPAAAVFRRRRQSIP